MGRENSLEVRTSQAWRAKMKSLLYECICEAFGTATIVFFISAVNCAIKLCDATVNHFQACVVIGMGVTLAVFVTGGVSGAHLNPSVTLALWVFRGFPGWKVGIYMGAQLIGGILGAVLPYLIYLPLILAYEKEHNIVRGTESGLEMIGMFATFPFATASIGTAFFTEIVNTFILLLLVFALTDDTNGTIKGALAPIMIGLTVTFIGSVLGPLTGYSMNGARDLGPRIFGVAAGYGTLTFTGGRSFPYFIVPLIGPLAGALLGAAFYVYVVKDGLRYAAEAQEMERLLADAGKAPALALDFRRPVYADAETGDFTVARKDIDGSGTPTAAGSPV